MRSRPPIALFNYQAYPPQLATEMLALGWSSLRPWLSPLAVAVVVGLCWGRNDHGFLLGWLAFSVVNGAAGIALRRRYQQLPATLPLPALRWGEWLALLHGGVMLGVIWGALGFLLVPAHAGHNLMIVMIYMGVSVSASSMASFGMAHVASASLVSMCLLLPPLRETFADDWLRLAIMFLFFHATIIQAVLLRHHGNARTLTLEKEKDRLIEEQRVAAESAQRANREKSAFLAAASHDLRQPLHALMLTSHALRMRVDGEESRELVAGGVGGRRHMVGFLYRCFRPGGCFRRSFLRLRDHPGAGQKGRTAMGAGCRPPRPHRPGPLQTGGP